MHRAFGLTRKKQRRIKWMKVYYILTFSSMHFNICTGFSD